MSTPSSCVQFKPGAEEFTIGPELPGYRSLSLHADGRIDTRVHRIETSLLP
jgi:Icc protein